MNQGPSVSSEEHQDLAGHAYMIRHLAWESFRKRSPRPTLMIALGVGDGGPIEAFEKRCLRFSHNLGPSHGEDKVCSLSLPRFLIQGDQRL